MSIGQKQGQESFQNRQDEFGRKLSFSFCAVATGTRRMLKLIVDLTKLIVAKN